MLRFLSDENLNNDIVRGLLRRKPEIDLVRVQDVGLSGADDPTVLAWAAQDGRVLLTQDVTKSRITPINVFKLANPCPASLQSSGLFPSALPSKTSCFLPNIVSKGNGKDKFAIFRCGEIQDHTIASIQRMLMSNHYHLLLETKLANLALSMRHLN